MKSKKWIYIGIAVVLGWFVISTYNGLIVQRVKHLSE